MTKKNKTIKSTVDNNSTNNEKSQNTSISSASSANSLPVSDNGNYLSKKLDSHQTNIKPRQHYLFPKLYSLLIQLEDEILKNQVLKDYHLPLFLSIVVRG